MANQYLSDISILVIDDQVFIRSMVRVMLRALGCERVHEAENGEDAWELMQSKTIDMVIADWKMSPMTGVELIKRIRNDEDSPNVYMPYIMISGYADRRRIIEARDAGISEFVVKPLSANALFSRIENIVESPRAFVRTSSFFGPDRRRKSNFVDHDRRDQEGAETKSSMGKIMKQGEIDDFLNPDTVHG